METKGNVNAGRKTIFLRGVCGQPLRPAAGAVAFAGRLAPLAQAAGVFVGAMNSILRGASLPGRIFPPHAAGGPRRGRNPAARRGARAGTRSRPASTSRR